MRNYVGIDLGTTNSAICSYDGAQTRIWKSPEQNDVTPSAIYRGRRGNKHVGKRAYDSAAWSPDNAATLFKRFMGTNTPIRLPAVDITMSPEECSAEVLRVLFGYLPEELRQDSDTGTVITVPAAFNQMQKNATMEAADMAGIGRVALMQEPVAAVMSVMHARNTDGIFVIYDFGGGTLDVAVAESLQGRINLLAHGGITMCGGRDFDRLLLDNVVKPWLFEEFDLPDNLSANPSYKKLLRIAGWAAERAKIELSARDETAIQMEETDLGVRDESGEEVYLDIPVKRRTLDELMTEKVNDSIEATRETLTKAGLSPDDVQRIVFVGGPTNYALLRERVSFELAIEASSEVNPMTAVAEGAAIFAESIDWESQSRQRKSSRGSLGSTGPFNVTFRYTARTPAERGRIVAQVEGEAIPGAEFQLESLGTGWNSGRIALSNGADVEVSLSRSGGNTFRVVVFDANGGPVSLEEDTIVITKTAAMVEAIPASHSIGVEACEKLGGTATMQWLICSGDELPKKGSALLKAGEAVRAGSRASLTFKLREGDSDEPEFNRLIGVLKITGRDFDDGVIYAGADLQCDYEMHDSGSIFLEVSVPTIGATFHGGHNYYSRQEGQVDFSADSERVSELGEDTLRRLEEMSSRVNDPKLDQALSKLDNARALDPDEPDAERVKEAMDGIEEARRLLADVRKRNRAEIRQMDLDEAASLWAENIKELATSSESNDLENLVRTAQRAIERDDHDFERHLGDLRGNLFGILWRQDWFAVLKFNAMASSPHRFSDPARFRELVAAGREHMQTDDINALRQVIAQLAGIQIAHVSESDIGELANIIRG